MYHSLSKADALAQLKSSKNGLVATDAAKRLKKYGPNSLKSAAEKISRLKIFLNQWKNPLILILIVAGIVSGLLGDTVDMTIIFITAGINGIIGFIQEDKANRALSKLRSLVTYKALVMRDGVKQQVDSDDVVPGDILYLAAGDKIQADARILESESAQVNEASLTGESYPISKQAKKLKEKTGVADRTNMVYRGTVVTAGALTVVVTATGEHTEIGKISKLVRDTTDDLTPLQRQLGKLSRVIGAVIVVVALLIFVLGLLVDSDVYEPLILFETAIAVAVAAIPEGLVISLTVILAVGMQHILRRRALVRKLVAAETLGSVSVICTDKTGTLTEGNMEVTQVLAADGHAETESEVLRVGVLCNDASIEKNGDGWSTFGDTTETALLLAGAEANLIQTTLAKQYKRIDAIPFDSDKKYMVTLHTVGSDQYMYVKGAPEVILQRSSHYYFGGDYETLDKKKLDGLKDQYATLTDKGLRVLAVAEKKTVSQSLEEKDVTELAFVGFIALSDPLRDDVRETIATAKQAGIHVVMITGDHARTARSIAAELGLPATAKATMEGHQLESMSEAELSDAIKKISIFARVDPKHKIKIVQAFQKRGDVVAMTGDGVNDAPALKGADIGVALGSGTDVAKEVSDMVLLNDSFSTIVAAIEEGRRIYQNIKKEVLYLMIGSFTEVLLIAATLVGRLPLAPLPAQILWINIIQESFPAMALAFDPGDKENMTDPPRAKHVPIMDRQMKVLLVIFMVVTNVVLFGLFLYFLKTTNNPALARTLMFVGIGVDSLIYIYSIRSMRRHIWQMNPFSNKYLTAAVVFGWLLLFSSIYVPQIRYLLQTVPLALNHWLIMFGFGLATVIVIEMIKSLYLIKSSYSKQK